jgi:hypothetical protein
MGMRKNLIVLIVLLLTANSALGEIPKPVKLKRISLPEKESGYRQFESTVVASEEEFGAFLDKTAKQKNWSHVDDFMAPLKNAKIDFQSNCLLLVRSTVGSGSIEVSLAEPHIVDDELVCQIEWKHPRGGYTQDVIFRCYALVVPKGIAKQVRVISPAKPENAVLKLPKRRGMVAPKP